MTPCRRHDWVRLVGPLILLADESCYQALTTEYCARCEQPRRSIPLSKKGGGMTLRGWHRASMGERTPARIIEWMFGSCSIRYNEWRRYELPTVESQAVPVRGAHTFSGRGRLHPRGMSS